MADQREIAHLILGIIGNISSCAFFISSIPTVLRIIKQRSPEGLSGDLYVLKLFNCLLWTFYGLPMVQPHNFWVFLTNSIGSFLSLIYIIIYVYFATRRERWNILTKLATISSVFLLLLVLLLVVEHSRRLRVLVVGLLCVIISSCMHLTLLSQLKMTLRTKDAKYMHPKVSIAGFIKGALWTAYGIVDVDVYIIIPNGVGVTTGILQLLIAMIIWRTPTDDLSKQPNGTAEVTIIVATGDDLSMAHDKETTINKESTDKDDLHQQRNLSIRVPSSVQIRGIVPLDDDFDHQVHSISIRVPSNAQICGVFPTDSDHNQ